MGFGVWGNPMVARFDILPCQCQSLTVLLFIPQNTLNVKKIFLLDKFLAFVWNELGLFFNVMLQLNDFFN